MVNGANYTNNGQALEPLRSDQIELGLKWELATDALLTLAAFKIDKGLVLDRNNGNGTRTRLQDGRQIHQGVELALSGQVTPELNVVSGVAYLDPTIEKANNTALIGKQPQGVAEWQANVFADYDLSQWLRGMSINGGVYYGGKKAIDPMNLWMADDYLRFDLGARYAHDWGNSQVSTIRLNLENVTGERYLSNTQWGALQFGAPRTVKMSLSHRF